jgi:hypothetical protein
VDEDREIRPTEKLDDLMIGYYLDVRRIDEIHKLFDMFDMEDNSNANTEQD